MSEPSNFEGWAVIEMMGHRREIGFVTTEGFGGAVLFRVDTPGFEEREYELASPQFVSGVLCGAGTKVKRPAVEGRTCFVAPGSLYALNPCTEVAAREAIERVYPREVQVVGKPVVVPVGMLENPPFDIDPEDDREEEFN